jgi:hypothetical protein
LLVVELGFNRCDYEVISVKNILFTIIKTGLNKKALLQNAKGL